jgi:DNA-directed RNA polymerase specialized sigma24 family protein
MPTKQKAIELLSKHHSEYIEMAKAIAGNHVNVKNYAEDYVQLAYMRLMRYDDLYDKVISAKGKVQKGYVFFVLRSIIINDIKKKSNLNFNYIGDQYDFEEVFMHVDTPREKRKVALERLESLMLEKLKQHVHWFDYELFNTYLTSGKSFKAIAAESGIGLRTIYLSIKKSKLIIAEHLHEDYLDFINGDFDLIQ